MKRANGKELMRARANEIVVTFSCLVTDPFPHHCSKKTSATIFSNHSEEHQRFFLMFQVRTHHVFSPGLVPIIILQSS